MEGKPKDQLNGKVEPSLPPFLFLVVFVLNLNLILFCFLSPLQNLFDSGALTTCIPSTTLWGIHILPHTFFPLNFNTLLILRYN